MTACPDCSQPVIERVSANGNGNDLLDRCEACGWFRVDHSLYSHNNPVSHLFKYRGLSEGVTDSSVSSSPGGPVSLAESEPKLCECGCGARAPIATHTNRAKGHVKGEPMRFILGHGRRHNNFGQF